MTTLRRIAKLMEEAAELHGKLHACETFKEMLANAREKETHQWIWNNKDKEKYKVGKEVKTALFISDIRAFVDSSLLTLLFNKEEEQINKIKLELMAREVELAVLQKPPLSMHHHQAPKPAPEVAEAQPTLTHKVSA